MKKLLLLLILNSSFLIVNCYSQQYGWVLIDPTSISGTPDFSDLYFTDDNTGWITSSSLSLNNVFKTTDGGANFTTQTTTQPLGAIHMVSATEGYCGGGSGFVFRTTTGGNTWSFLGTMGNTLSDISFPPGGTTGYACGINGAIRSITSGGVTIMTSGVGSDLRSISFPVSSNEGWVCGTNIIRHYTGGSWVADQVNITGSWNAIFFLDNQMGWVVGDAGQIKHTSDGIHWNEQLPYGSGNSLFGVFFVNASEGWAVGGNGTILHTTNGGTNWNVEGSGLTTSPLRAVHFTSPTNGYIVGNVKTLLHYTLLTDVEEKPTQLTEFKLEQNYPNPFNPSTRIQYQVSSISRVTLKVYDVLGNEIATLVDGYNPAGTYEVEFSAKGLSASGGNLASHSGLSGIRELPSGIYFYQLQAGSFIQTKKMIFIK